MRQLTCFVHEGILLECKQCFVAEGERRDIEGHFLAHKKKAEGSRLMDDWKHTHKKEESQIKNGGQKDRTKKKSKSPLSPVSRRVQIWRSLNKGTT
jgi:hypothetical protein